MACFHPNPVIILGDKYLPLSSKGVRNGVLFVGKNTESVKVWDKQKFKVVEIPKSDFSYTRCGMCKGCKFDDSIEIANRCTLETFSHQNNLFLTLTYDDKNLVWGNERPTLVPKHMQNFNKDLRSYLKYHKLEDEKPLKLLYSGEYGDRTKRPHYHGIYCGLNIPDLKVYKTNFDGDIYYTSEILNSIWKKGFVVVGQANWQSSAYVARYVVKKRLGLYGKLYYALNEICPEFHHPSINLGREYYETHKDDIYFEKEKIIVPDKNGFRKIQCPKTFDAWFEAESPEDFESLKNERQENAKKAMNLELSQTDLDIYSYLAVKERNFVARTESLKRGLC